MSTSSSLFRVRPARRVLSRAAATTVGAAVLVATAAIAPASAAPAAVSPNPGSSASTDGRVEAMVAAAGKVFIAGRFTTVNGSKHHSVAAVTASGGVVSGFHAAVSGEVKAVATDGRTLYLGGAFSTVNGARRENLAAVRLSDGGLTSWNPGANRTVEALAFASGKVIVGGRFQTIAHHSAANLAALQPGSGAIVSGFRGNATGFVFALQAAPSRGVVYVGGAFGAIAGASRRHLAAVSLGSGAPTGWHPSVGCPVYDIAAAGSSLYVGCGGGKKTGNRLSAYSTSGTGARWTVQTDGNVQAVAVVGGTIYAGGHFGHAGGTVRHHAFAVSGSGSLLSWSPRFNSALGVWELLATGGSLWAGGDFTTVNDARHPHLARFPG